MDFNTAKKHEPSLGGLLPKGAIVPVHLTLRPGGSGDGGWLKRNKDGTCMMLDCEFTVVEGEFARRKFWTMLVVEGETDGQKEAASITGSLVRGILESARGVQPADESASAQDGRRISEWGDLDGMRFWAVVGVRKQQGYDDKNNLAGALTPDKKGWTKLDQVATQKRMGGVIASQATAAPRAAAGRPSWAA